MVLTLLEISAQIVVSHYNIQKIYLPKNLKSFLLIKQEEVKIVNKINRRFDEKLIIYESNLKSSFDLLMKHTTKLFWPYRISECHTNIYLILTTLFCNSSYTGDIKMSPQVIKIFKLLQQIVELVFNSASLDELCSDEVVYLSNTLNRWNALSLHVPTAYTFVQCVQLIKMIVDRSIKKAD